MTHKERICLRSKGLKSTASFFSGAETKSSVRGYESQRRGYSALAAIHRRHKLELLPKLAPNELLRATFVDK